MKKIYDQYVYWVYTILFTIGAWVTLNLAAALTFHDSEWEITAQEIKK